MLQPLDGYIMAAYSSSDTVCHLWEVTNRSSGTFGDFAEASSTLEPQDEVVTPVHQRSARRTLRLHNGSLWAKSLQSGWHYPWF